MERGDRSTSPTSLLTSHLLLSLLASYFHLPPLTFLNALLAAHLADGRNIPEAAGCSNLDPGSRAGRGFRWRPPAAGAGPRSSPGTDSAQGHAPEQGLGAGD